MSRIIFTLMSLMLASCTPEPSSNNDSVSLSVDTPSLEFDAEGGEKTFVVTSLKTFYMLEDESWITTQKGAKNLEHQSVVTVTAEKNPSSEARQTRISVIAGDEKQYVEILQEGQPESAGKEEENPEKQASMLVALSFDDGPNNQITPQVLDILEEFNVPASFFVIGQNINDSTAEQMKRAVALGCEIQNHSYTHTYMTKLSADEFRAELERTDALVEKYIGKRPTFFRPPYIDQNKSMHDDVEHTFISGLGCLDWEASQTAEMRFNSLMANVQDGDIILLHDFVGNDNTVAALRLIIPELKKRGYGLVTVSRLFELKNVNPQPHSGYLYTNVLQNTAIQYR